MNLSGNPRITKRLQHFLPIQIELKLLLRPVDENTHSTSNKERRRAKVLFSYPHIASLKPSNAIIVCSE